MKSWITLAVLSLSTAYSTLASADLQPQESPKAYISTEQLHISESGMFLVDANDQLLPLSQLQYDAGGYYITGLFDFLFPQASYIAKCRNCGFEYARDMPVPCASCNEDAGYEIIHLGDYYDRG